MKIAGIIVEYNPFHKGHLYHLQQTKKRTGADYVIAIMSGDWVQRGAPALLDKHLRTSMALSCGVDLVLELPVSLSLGSAEFFASGAVNMLDKLGCVDFLVFGSEAGDTDSLIKAAKILSDETPSFKETLQDALRTGMSYPQARALALKKVLESKETDSNDPASLPTTPNDILGMEYCRALLSCNSTIRPIALKRRGSGYHENSLATDFPSASGIRRAVWEEKENTAALLPSQIHDLWEDACCRQLFLNEDDFSTLLYYKLSELSYSRTKREFSSILQGFGDVSSSLADKISSRFPDFSAWKELCDGLKTKDVTYTRISRALSHILLNITKEELLSLKESGYISYTRILGFKQDALPLLSVLKKRSSFPLLSKLADSSAVLSREALHNLEKDIAASHLYQSVLTRKSGQPFQNEYRRQILRV